MENKDIVCKFNFSQAYIISTINKTQIQVETKYYCPFATTLSHPTKCMYSKKCEFQKIE